MKKYLILFCNLIMFVGCTDKQINKDENKKNRLYLKEIQTNGKIIEWFFYSNIGSTTVDYVIVNDKINNKNDTIVKSTNIKNLSFSNDTIVLSFYGKPKVYQNYITLKNNIAGFDIKIDTTAISSGPTVRKFYQKNKL